MDAIAFYGGSFNPPTIAHSAIVDHLLKVGAFKKVLVKPCGTRVDKPELTESLDQRISLIKKELSRANPDYHLDMSAISQPMVPTVTEWKNLKNLYPSSLIYFVAGTDLFVKEADARCQIQKWVDGQTLFDTAHFYIFERPHQGQVLYPPNCTMADEFRPIDISSSELRARGIYDSSGKP